MNEFLTYEYVIPQKIEGKWIWAKAGLLTLYISLAIAALLIGIQTRLMVPLIALLPVALWILVFCTWRYTNVEYEYSITSGELTFCKIYGNRSRHRILTLDLRKAARIAPEDGAEHSARAAAYRPEVVHIGISGKDAKDVYYILFEEETKKGNRKRAALYLEVTHRALQVFRFYNSPATVLTEVSK